MGNLAKMLEEIDVAESSPQHIPDTAPLISILTDLQSHTPTPFFPFLAVMSYSFIKDSTWHIEKKKKPCDL